MFFGKGWWLCSRQYAKFPLIVLLNLTSKLWGLCVDSHCSLCNMTCNSSKQEIESISLSLESGQVFFGLAKKEEDTRPLKRICSLLLPLNWIPFQLLHEQVQASLLDDEKCVSVIYIDPGDNWPTSRNSTPRWLAAEPKTYKWAQLRIIQANQAPNAIPRTTS